MSIKNTNKKGLSIVAALIAVALLCTATFLIFRQITKENTLPVSAEDTVSREEVPISAGSYREMRGIWIATVSNIDFPSAQKLSVSKLKAELDDIVSTCKNAGINAIFFQAVPSSDALYKSERYPWSAVITGMQGKAPDDGFDPLAYITEKAHSENIELHAWMNPYRVTSSSATAFDSLSESNPARQHPEYCVCYNGAYYYNPALPEVREMIADEAAYIAANYGVDGIQIDDYFYPYPVSGCTFDDSAEYEQYGNGASLADWRRNNVDLTVKGMYDAIKNVRKDCRFGVAPAGIYSNRGSGSPITGSATTGFQSYSEIYCDAPTWAKEGYVDYLAPQVYWAFGTTAAPFDVVSRWWNAVLDGTGVDLYIGHALYKTEEFSDKNEMVLQANFARSLLCCKGSIFYGYSAFKKNTCSVYDKLRQFFAENSSVRKEISSNGRDAVINYPANGYKATGANQFILGASDPTKPITINGEPISRTKDGYFTLYTSLSQGNNNFTIRQGEQKVEHTVSYGVTSQSSGILYAMESFDILETTPGCETWITGGDTISFSCTAPAQSEVYAGIGNIKIKLSPQYGRKNAGSVFVKEVYTGSYKFPTAAKEGEIIVLGTLSFTAKNGGNSVTKNIGLIKEIGDGALIYAQVNKDYTYLKKSPSSSFYDDYTPTSPGMRDYITGFSGGYYRLKFGGYVSSENVTVVEGQPLYKNAVLTAESEVKKDKKETYENNYTELRFGVLENVPVDVWVEGREVTIVLYDTLPEAMPKMKLVGNPLFSSVTAKAGASGKTILYTAMLKDADNYYGFRLEYDSSFIKLKFNNPVGLEKGDHPLEGKLIYVDAGHGGVDIGSRGCGTNEQAMFESNLNLLIANSLAKKLESLGASVYTTRTEDVEIDLYERLDMISAVVPDMLISVHHNSVGDTSDATKVRGFVSLYSNNSGILLAKTVSDVACRKLPRYQRTSAYQMLAMARDHRFPSTLCEVSFICCAEEFQWTLEEGNIDKTAQALCDGIIEYYNRQESYK